MKAADLKTLNELRSSRRAALVLTRLGGGETQVLEEGQSVGGELAEPVAKAFRTGKSVTVQTGNGDYFLNVHLPPPRLVVIGAVHITQALVPIANLAGYAIEVIDPRTAFATPERFAGTELFAEWPEDVLADRPLDPFCALAAVTHDPKIDDFPLRAALDAGCFYVGALGSRKTHAGRLERLHAGGMLEAKTERIHAPIGLDIGASSPQEIAVAIMAEIIQAFRTRGL